MATLGSTGALPTIKCSSCGVDIDIERMADHLCGPASVTSIAKSAPRNFKDAFSNMSINQSIPAPFRQKPVPQPIDSIAANTSFLGRTRLAAAMQNPNHMAAPSPITRKPLFTPPQLGIAAFPRAPSPELSLPQDCAFPAFPLPSKSPITKKPESNRIPITRSDSNNEFAYKPITEINSSTNTIVPSRQWSQSGHALEEQKSKELMAPAQIFSNSDREPKAEHPASPAPYQTVANTSAESLPTISTPRRLGTPTLHDRKKSVSAANRPLDEIGSVRTHRSAASRSGNAFMASGYGLPRSASAQGYLHGGSLRDRPPPIPDTINSQGHNIVRSASAMAAHQKTVYDTPPLPTQTHTRSDSRNLTGHSSSDSTSSNQSETSQPTTSSSRSSPPASPPRRTLQDGVGDLHARTVKGLGIQSDQPIEPAVVKIFSRPTHAQPKSSTTSSDPIERVSSGAQQSNHPQQAPGVLSPETLELVSAGPWQSLPQNKSQAPGILSPETLDQVSAGPWQSELHRDLDRIPQDNGTHGGFRSNDGERSLAEPKSKFGLKGNTLPALQISGGTSTISSEFKESARSAVMPSTHNQAIFNGSPSPSNHTSLRRAATTSKGKCRGCSQAITGKSVSSADRRLTGRWHKQCFTCKTCKEPFPTMDFYVLGNDPYCNRHYHQLNKSLCASCDRGIEGQYVENEQQKFHPHCFSCNECHLILRDTYFDLNGKIYCERHAFKPNKLVYPGAGRRYPEKRSTRLMMI